MTATSRTLKPCGTPAACQRHYKRGEPIDQACREAIRLYNQVMRQLRGRPATAPQPRRTTDPDTPTGYADRHTPDPALAAVGAVDRCGLDIPQTAALLEVSVERCRTLLTEGRHLLHARTQATP